MRKNKFIVLFSFVIALAALAVTSQIAELNPSSKVNLQSKITKATEKITLEEPQDCTITYYNATENVYGNVTRTRASNSTCFNPINLSYYTCFNGTESYQSYEVVAVNTILKNSTNCISKNSYVVSVNKNGITAKKKIDFSNWGPCIQNVENNCSIVTCVSKYDGAHNGQFTDCRGGKSCQKFVICEDSIKAYYKNSRDDFVEEDPSFYMGKLAMRDVGE